MFDFKIPSLFWIELEGRALFGATLLRLNSCSQMKGDRCTGLWDKLQTQSQLFHGNDRSQTLLNNACM